MNVAQNLSAIFNSPQWAEVNLQAIQAADMAERQVAETRRREALRRESQVTGSARADESEGVRADESGTGGGGGGALGRRPGRGAESAGGDPGGPTVGDGDGHRIDLVA